MPQFAFLVLVTIVLLTSTARQLGADEPPKYRAPDAITRFRPQEELLRVPVSIGDESFLFVLDTGSPITVVDKSLRPLIGRLIEIQFLGSGFGAAFHSIHERPELRIGDPALSELTLPQGGRIASADLSVLRETFAAHGILGQDLMRNWVSMISFDEGSISIWNGLNDTSMFEGRRIPIDFKSDNRPYVQARITGGRDQSFCVDTGSTNSATNSAWRRSRPSAMPTSSQAGYAGKRYPPPAPWYGAR